MRLSPQCQKLGFAELCPQNSVTLTGLETNPHSVSQSPLHGKSLDRAQTDYGEEPAGLMGGMDEEDLILFMNSADQFDECHN